jgi:hypothetical protein
MQRRGSLSRCWLLLRLLAATVAVYSMTCMLRFVLSCLLFCSHAVPWQFELLLAAAASAGFNSCYVSNDLHVALCAVLFGSHAAPRQFEPLLAAAASAGFNSC